MWSSGGQVGCKLLLVQHLHRSLAQTHDLAEVSETFLAVRGSACPAPAGGHDQTCSFMHQMTFFPPVSCI